MITEHVVSKDIAKRLKRAKFPQDTAFVWCDSQDGCFELFSRFNVLVGFRILYSAPLFTEILEHLPMSEWTLNIWQDHMGQLVLDEYSALLDVPPSLNLANSAALAWLQWKGGK